MQNHFHYSLFLMLFFVAVESCQTNENAESPIVNSDEPAPVETTEETVQIEQIELEGNFRSMQGVKDDLSCFTNNGGYLWLEDSTEVALIFHEDAAVSNCDSIKVMGSYTTKKFSESGCAAQMGGFMNIFEVLSFECF